MKLSIGVMALVAVLVTPLVGAAQEAELSANVGFASEYFYRGIPQKGSSASGGLDLAVSKVYLGTWAADVGDGNETFPRMASPHSTHTMIRTSLRMCKPPSRNGPSSWMRSVAGLATKLA